WSWLGFRCVARGKRRPVRVRGRIECMATQAWSTPYRSACADPHVVTQGDDLLDAVAALISRRVSLLHRHSRVMKRPSVRGGSLVDYAILTATVAASMLAL